MSRRQLRDTAAYTLLSLLPYLFGFFLLPIYTQYLPIQEYGVIVLAAITQAFIVQFAGLSFDRALPRLLFDASPQSGGRERLLAQALLSGFVFSAATAALLWLLGDWIFALVWGGELPFADYGWILLATAVFTMINLTLFQYHRTQENLRAAIIVILIPYTLSLGGSLLGIVAFRGGAWESLVGKMLGLGLGTLPILIPLLLRIPLRWDSKRFSELSRYCLPVFALTLIFLFGESIDRVLLNRLLSFEELALYGFAYTITIPATQLLVSYNLAVHPSVIQALALHQPEAPAKLKAYFGALLSLAMFSFWAFLGLVFPLILLISDTDYAQAEAFLPMLAFLIFGRAGDYISTFHQFQEKRTRFLPLAQAIYIGLLVLCIQGLVSPLGATGAALAIAICQVPFVLIRHGFERLVSSQPGSLRAFFGLLLANAAVVAFNEIWLVRQLAWPRAPIYALEALVVFATLLILHRGQLRAWLRPKTKAAHA